VIPPRPQTSNVIVGVFGVETIVVEWGLARDASDDFPVAQREIVL